MECRITDLINPCEEYEVDMAGQWISYPLNPDMRQSVRHSQSLGIFQS